MNIKTENRIISILMAVAWVLVMLGGMAVSVSAADTPSLGYSVTGIGQGPSQRYWHPGETVEFPVLFEDTIATAQRMRDDGFEANIYIDESIGLRNVVHSLTLTSNENGEAILRLTFIDPYISVHMTDFGYTIELARNSKPVQSVGFDGTLWNHEQEVHTGQTYADLVGTPVIRTVGAVDNIDLDLGEGLVINASLNHDEKCYGYLDARDRDSAMDEDLFLLDKHPSIEKVYYVYTVNLNRTGFYVTISLPDAYYVYNADLEYMGRTDGHLNYASKYYLSKQELDVGEDPGTPTNPITPMTPGTPSTGSSDSSGSSGSGSSGGSDGSTTTSTSSNTPVNVTTSTATTAAKSAAQKAKATGASTATANIKNPGDISLAALQAMAKEAGMPLKLQADSMTADGKAVDVRITVDPSQSTKGLNLFASTTNNQAKATTNFFEKYFDNDVMTVSLGQQGNFGQSVEIAAKLAPDLDTDNLVFYTYDKETNSYKAIPTPNYWVDKNGYVHFTTSIGGSIVISDGPLEPKGENAK